MTKKKVEKMGTINKKFKRAIEGLRKAIPDLFTACYQHFIVFDILRKMYELGYSDGVRAGKKK